MFQRVCLGVENKGDLRLCSRDSHRPRSWLAHCSWHRYRQSAWPRIAGAIREAGVVTSPVDRRETTARGPIPEGAAITPRADLLGEAITLGDRASSIPADTPVARAIMVAATSLRVPTDGPLTAEIMVQASTWVMAFLMDTRMVPAIPSIRAILMGQPPRRNPAPKAHTIGMGLGFRIQTAIPANSSISRRSKTTIPINRIIRRHSRIMTPINNIRSPSRITIPINSIRSPGRTTIPISRDGTIDNRFGAGDSLAKYHPA